MESDKGNIKEKILKNLELLSSILKEIKEIEKKDEVKRERFIWTINETEKESSESYFKNINEDLSNIINIFQQNSTKIHYNIFVLPKFLEGLIEDLKNQSGNVDESVVKLKLNILTNYLYSSSLSDLDILKFYNFTDHCNEKEKEEEREIEKEKEREKEKEKEKEEENLLKEILTVINNTIQEVQKSFYSLNESLTKMYEIANKMNDEEISLLENIQKTITVNMKTQLPISDLKDKSKVLAQQKNFFEDLEKFSKLIKDSEKKINSNQIIQSFFEENYGNNHKDNIEALLGIKDDLFKIFDKISRNSMFYHQVFLPKTTDAHDLIYFLQCMTKPKCKLSDNYFSHVFFKEEELNLPFKEIYKNIFSSKCVITYYKEVEEWEDLNKEYISYLENPNTFERFYERIIFVPLPYYYNGLTDATLITFINSYNRKTIYKTKYFLKELFDAAALIVTLVHEANHFIRRYLNMGRVLSNVNTQEKFFKKGQFGGKKAIHWEGGKMMSSKIFGKELIKRLNIFGVCYILDIRNWTKDYNEFRSGFLEINEDIEYVKEVLPRLKESFGINLSEEIDEVLNNTKKFEEVCKQTVHCENTDKEPKYQSICLGRCFIDLARQKDPNYII